MADQKWNESFAGLLLRYRGRSGLTQHQLASRVGVHRRSIQVWESGISHPSAARLQALIAAFLDAGAFSPGDEAADAEALWEAALCEAPRMHTPFDLQWLDELIGGGACSQFKGVRAPGTPSTASAADTADASSVVMRRQDWGDAPTARPCVGRTGELTLIREQILNQRCQVVELVGMGGIGKTTLATRLGRELAPSFDVLCWRSSTSAPSLGAWLADVISCASENVTALPDFEEARLTMLLHVLRERRCLLVLDNVETLLEPTERSGSRGDGWSGFGRLLQLVAETSHKSCLVLTSRVASPDLSLFVSGRVHSQELVGFDIVEAQLMLDDKHLRGTKLDWADLVSRCGGNPLVLLITGETIRQVFGSDIRAFLDMGGTAVHAQVRRLLESQLDERLSTLEKQLLRVLAGSYMPLTHSAILAEFGPRFGRGVVIEALMSLRRRSVMRQPVDAGLSLQPIVRDYVAVQLVRCAAG